jgi:hypothetical protein
MIYQEEKVKFRRKLYMYLVEEFLPIEQSEPATREIELFSENAPEKNGIKLCDQYFKEVKQFSN